MGNKTVSDSSCTDLLSETQLQRHKSLPNGVLAKLLAIFESDTPNIIQAMRQTLAKGDFESLAAAAHGLKGSSLTMGAKALPLLCADLQKYAKEKNILKGEALLSEMEDCFHETCKQFNAFLKKS